MKKCFLVFLMVSFFTCAMEKNVYKLNGKLKSLENINDINDKINLLSKQRYEINKDLFF